MQKRFYDFLFLSPLHITRLTFLFIFNVSVINAAAADEVRRVRR